MNGRILLLAALPLLVASCNVQESTFATAQDDVILAPRFAATAIVPDADSVTVVLKTESGEHDTSRTVPFVRGGQIPLGRLPPDVRFTLTMKGWSYVDGHEVIAWWTSAKDSSGSNTQRRITMPDPQQSVTPLSSSIPESSRPTNGGDSVLFKGKLISLPAGAYVTTDGSDPRTSGSAKPAIQPYMTDSAPTIRIAVKTEARLDSGRPALWSPVKTFHLVVDPLDTLTSLDTLILSSWSRWSDSIDLDVDTNATTHKDSLNSSGVIQAQFLPDVFERTDTLVSFFGDDPLSVKLHCYVVPSTVRATIRVGLQPVPPDSFVEIFFPRDSTVKVIVDNHGHSRTYTIRLASKPNTNIPERLDSLKSPSTGLKRDPTDNTKFMIEVPAGQDSLTLQPFVSPECSTRIAGKILASGEMTAAPVGQDTATILLEVFHDRTDVTPLKIVVRVSHTLPIAFRDTTNGVPWRDAPYDTLVYNSRKYRTVVVGTARWMAENLNYRVDSSFCAGQSVEVCAKFGRLYTWAGAADTTPHYDSVGLPFSSHLQGVCPVGWHLPSASEWQTLIDLLGSSRAAALLQSYGTSWIPATGQDSLGMRILPAGHRTITVTAPFYYLAGQNSEAWFWSSTQSATQKHATAFRISSNTGLVSFVPENPKAEALSVRCVSDTAVVAP